MATKTLPSQAYLRQCFDYNPATGALTWKVRPVEHFYSQGVQQKWVKHFAGMIAGTEGRNGYRRVWLNGSAYFTHRIVWKIMTGEDPRFIDHINRDGSDLRWANIRECLHQQNCQNRGLRSDNIVRRQGVTPSGKRWMARITNNGDRLYLGSFDTVEEAHAARQKAEDAAFGKFRPIQPPS